MRSLCFNAVHHNITSTPAFHAGSPPLINANLYSLIRDHFPGEGEQPCLMIPGGRVIHYGDIDQASARIAHALVDAGCQPGDRVAAQIEKSWHGLALYLACLRSGAVFLPLNTGYRKGELSWFFSDARPRIIVCAPSAAREMLALRPEAVILTLEDDEGSLLEAASEQPESFETVFSKPGDLAAILYTSGTTGRSKGAMLSHRNLASNALTLVSLWGFTRHDVLLHALPIYHVHGLFVACHCALLSGSRILWLAKFDASEVLHLLPRATVMMGVPTFYTRLLAEREFSADHCQNVRVFISGSAPLLPDTFAAFADRTGHLILERYGMTETGMNTSNPLDGPRRCGSVGPALPGVDLRVVREDGSRCEPGVVGAIEVHGPNVFRGYWDMQERNEQEFTPDGYFRTGDLGEMLEDGYLRIVGRAKDVIITGGLNVYPREIETRIDAMPGVLESAVIGIPDPDFGEAVVAVVVAKQGYCVDPREVIAALREDIAGFKVPKLVHLVSELPRNAMGKVQKSALREQYACVAAGPA